MSQSESIPESVERIIDDPDAALRAPKDIGDKAHPDADSVEDPRTAVRYIGEEETVPQFQVVTTGLTSFPLGKDTVTIQSVESVAKWARANDLEEIAVGDEDGFKEVDVL